MDSRRTFLKRSVWLPLFSLSLRSLSAQNQPQNHATVSIVPEKWLKGENYELSPRISLSSHHYQFQIITDWGVLKASGLNQLRIRLYEMQCLELMMDERWELQSLQGAFDSLQKTPEGALIILRDPIGTILRTPQGLSKLVRQRFNEADKRAGGSTRRQLAAKVGCDPETSNPLLTRLLDEISTRNKVGKIAARIGMSVAVPGLGLLALNTDIQNTVTTHSPSEINNSLDKTLKAEGVRERIRDEFLNNLSFTTTEKLVLMEYLGMLKNVPGRFSMIENAAAAKNETQALAVLEETAQLVSLHREDALNEIRFIGLTICRRKSGPVMVIASVDHLTDSGDIGRMAEALRRQYPREAIEVQVMGVCSTGAEQILANSRIKVRDQLREPFTVPPLENDTRTSRNTDSGTESR